MADIEKAREEILKNSHRNEGLSEQEVSRQEKQLHEQILEYKQARKEAEEEHIAEAFKKLARIKEQYAKEQERLDALYEELKQEYENSPEKHSETRKIIRRWEYGREPCSKETRQTIGHAFPVYRNLFRNLSLRRNRHYHRPFAAFYIKNATGGERRLLIKADTVGGKYSLCEDWTPLGSFNSFSREEALSFLKEKMEEEISISNHVVTEKDVSAADGKTVLTEEQRSEKIEERQLSRIEVEKRYRSQAINELAEIKERYNKEKRMFVNRQDAQANCQEKHYKLLMEKNSYHFLGLFFNISIWVCLILFMAIIRGKSYGLIFIAITYMAYLIEALSASTLKYLLRMKTVDGAIEYINQLKASSPVISLYYECYHYEKRTRTVSDTRWMSVPTNDPNNPRSTESYTVYRDETYQEKVVTHSGREYFNFSRFEDYSGDVSNNIYDFTVTKIALEKYWTCGDATTMGIYRELKNRLYQYRYLDKHFEFSESITIKDFHDKLLVVIGESPAFIHYGVYVMASILTLSWPYRIWFENVTATVKFVIKKRIFV